MTDEELHSSWPDLGRVVIELRRLQHAALADRLVNAVQYSSTSGELHSGVGNALHEHRALRKQLSAPGVRAWKSVMAEVRRAFGRPPFLEWIAGLFGRKS